EKNTASSMRSKEEAHDYRYFPDPDLVPVVVDEQWIAAAKKELPELPAVRRARFVNEYKLPSYDAEVLTQERPLADYFEGAVRVLTNRNDEQVKTVSNWVMTEVMRVMNESGTAITEFPVPPMHLGALVDLIAGGTISGKIAKEVFAEMVTTKEHPKAVVERKGLVQISDTGAIETEIDAILAKFPNEIARFRGGEAKLMGFFVGETMKVMKGKGNPKMINEILGKKLKG
nr:Asp-tRNA(Asn)/Glu-tRNA(Gln) amidotransferase GatCAB subunit B [Bacteroidota bacterium]